MRLPGEPVFRPAYVNVVAERGHPWITFPSPKARRRPPKSL